MKIFEYHNISLAGKSVCILGRSNIVGKPLALLCINAGATVTSCNSQTKEIKNYTQKADIIIAATGQAHILTPDMVKNTACIIDVGFSFLDGKIVGDADTESFLQTGHMITPVP